MDSVMINYNSQMVTLGVRIMQLYPRTSNAVLETIVGFDNQTHSSPGREPMIARNDFGGTSTKNLEHWAMNTRDGKFADYQGKEYNVVSLRQNLAKTNILLLVGSNDAFCA